MVQVTFTEVQTHGTFRVALSHDNVSFGTVLLDNIAVQTSGASRMVTVQMPATTCDACVLQLFQRNGNGGYYSCADIRVMAAATTTTATTTTLPFDGSSTTTTTTVPPSDPCADQVDYDAADCRIGTALADLPCAGDVMDPTLDTAVRAGLRKVQALLGMARSKTKPTQANHILKKADHKLAALTKRAARTAAHGRTSATCASNVDALIAEIRDAIAALAAGA